MLRLITFTVLVAAAWAAVLSVPADVDVPVGAVLVAEGPSPGPETYDCTGKDGYFADYYRQCHVFYRCLPDGTKFTYTCILQLQFNETVNYQTCMDPRFVTCPTPTTKLLLD